MDIRIEATPGFYLSAFSQFSRYDRRALANRVEDFVQWKRGGNVGERAPFSADKPSGRRGEELVFPRYRDLNLWHCHLDLDGTEPLLAYRVFDDQRRILMLRITSHVEMFGRPERFYRQIRGETRGDPV